MIGTTKGHRNGFWFFPLDSYSEAPHGSMARVLWGGGMNAAPTAAQPHPFSRGSGASRRRGRCSHGPPSSAPRSTRGRRSGSSTARSRWAHLSVCKGRATAMRWPIWVVHRQGSVQFIALDVLGVPLGNSSAKSQVRLPIRVRMIALDIDSVWILYNTLDLQKKQ